jgi:diguanylate cyclase (GGDEF)-like protein/PAS domain S-box-containing protein
VHGAIVMNMRELTDRHGWQVSAGDPELLRTLLEHLPTIAVLLNADGIVLGANRALTRSLHRPVERTRGGSFFDLVADVDRRMVADEVAAVIGTAGTRHLEASLLTASGDALPMSLAVVDMTTDQAVRGVVVVAHDISALVDARRELRRLAGHDDLTGLPNRTTLRDHLTQLLAEPSEAAHTVLFGDVDALKAVNDRHGHRAGDALLVVVAERLRSVLRPDDFVARIGGDEFVMVVATADDRVLEDLQDRIGSAMAAPVVLPGGHRVTTSISIGVARIEPTLDADDLLAAADAAMYVTKRERGQGR